MSIQDAEAIERELYNYAGHDSHRHRQWVKGLDLHVRGSRG